VRFSKVDAGEAQVDFSVKELTSLAHYTGGVGVGGSKFSLYVNKKKKFFTFPKIWPIVPQVVESRITLEGPVDRSRSL
jgi:hypothetical protein